MTSFLTPPHLLDTQRWQGRRIGLFGGSFNPAHDGHLHVAKTALESLKLDYIWWLVTPQNPLKNGPAGDVMARIKACEALITHPKMLVCALESTLQTKNSYQSVKALKRAFPKTGFIWISGMDNALSLHRWNNWRDLLAEIPFLHVTRPPADSLVQNCPLRFYGPQTHKIIQKPGRYPLTPHTTYWMMGRKMNAQSSTNLRNAAPEKFG